MSLEQKFPSCYGINPGIKGIQGNGLRKIGKSDKKTLELGNSENPVDLLISDVPVLPSWQTWD